MKRKLMILAIATSISMQNINVVNALNNKTTENINNLVVFIDFNDTNSFKGNESKAREVENTFNDFADDNNDNVSNEGKISLKSYVYDLTKGKTIIDSSFYPKSETTSGYESYKAPIDRSYYERKTMGSSYEQNLIKNAFNDVKDEINLSPEELDKDNDGNIDGVTFVFSGSPAVSGGSMLRQHMAELKTNNPTLNGKKLSKYNMIAEGSRSINIYNKNMLATISHEYLHMLGYPDLYRDGSGTNLVGRWDIMGDTKLMPQLPLVYSRNTYGNSNLKVQEITESGVYTLKSASKLGSEDTVAFKIKSKDYPNEYFMIEYRKNDAKWDNVLPGSGIIIYRINDNIHPMYGNNTNRGAHVYMFRDNDNSPNSGTGNIDNIALSKESSKTTFGTVSQSIFDFDPNSIYYSDGTNSNIVISEVGSTSSDEISFKIELPKESDKIVGDGSLTNPYQIDSTNDFKQMHLTPNKNFILTKDIDFDGVQVSPIGNVDKPFSGSLEGNGHTISNLKIDSNSEDVGFIGRLSEKGRIQNINFENIDIKSGGIYTGGVVGNSAGKIENVTVSGNIQSSSELAIGGIVGYSDYKAGVKNSKSSVNISSTYASNVLVGGVVGDGYNSLVKNNYFNGKIKGHEKNKVGAIFGRNILNEESSNIDSIDNVFNITSTNLEKGVGQVEMPQFGETDKGVVGIELLKDVKLEKGSLSNEIVKYKNNLEGTKNENIFSNNESIAKVSNNKIQAVSQGKTNVVYELTLGANKIKEKIDVSVSDSSKIIEINDKSLKNAIKTSLGLEKDEITIADMQKVTSLNFEDDMYLRNLSGLEYATNLESLNINYNEVSDLSPLKNLKNLKEITGIENYVMGEKALIPNKDNYYEVDYKAIDINGEKIKPSKIIISPNINPIELNLDEVLVDGKIKIDANLLSGNSSVDIIYESKLANYSLYSFYFLNK